MPVNYQGLPPVAFTLREFQTALLFGRANYKEKSTIFSAAFPLLHRLPPMVSTGSIKRPLRAFLHKMNPITGLIAGHTD